MSTQLFWFLHFLALAQGGTIVKFTRVECECKNESIATFSHCYVKPVSRHVGEFSLLARIRSPPWTYILGRIESFRKYGIVYRPYVMNYTLELCEFLRLKNHIFVKFLYNMIEGYHNMNHTCPYSGDIIINGFPSGMTNISLPVPAGQYMMVARGSIKLQGKLYTGPVVKLWFEFEEVYDGSKILD